MLMRSVLMKAGWLLAAGLGGAPFVRAACLGPQPLQARLQAHPDADTYVALGTWFGDRHQYACAIEAYRGALKFDPNSAQLHYLVGLSLYFSGHSEESVKPLQQSIELASDVLKPHLILGAAFDELHRGEEARAQWVAALKIDSHSAIALDGLSKNLIAAGDYISVIALLRSTPAPRDEKLTLDLALALDRAGMLDDAADTLTQALAKAPSSLPLSNVLATVLVKQGHPSEATRVAEKSVRLHPRDLGAKKLYLQVLVFNDDMNLAVPLAAKLIAAAPHDSDVLYLNGILERVSGKYAAARSHLEEAISLVPDYYNSRYNLGLVLTELGDAKGAREQLEKALALGAKEPEVRFKLAAVLRTLGETQLAQEQLKLYQQERQEKADRSIAASKAAQAAKAVAAKDMPKAVALYRDAVAASPRDVLLAYKLAMALDTTGDTAAELSVLEQVVKLDPDFALAQNQLGYLLSRSGDSEGAEEHFRQAVRAAPGYTQAWVSLAATLGVESRFPEAQEAIASALRLDPDNAEARQLREELTSAQAQR
jgi:tetratricopeptide (TPR) repeat protein